MEIQLNAWDEPTDDDFEDRMLDMLDSVESYWSEMAECVESALAATSTDETVNESIFSQIK